MKVSSTGPFEIVYSLYQHEFLGFLFESYVVQKSQSGKLTLQHQVLSLKNATDFRSGMDEVDIQLIGLIDTMQPEAVFLKCSDKKGKPNDFFLKVFDKNKGDEELQEYIRTYVNRIRVQIMPLLQKKRLFEMGNDGEPTFRELYFEEERATVLFHFYRNEQSMHYLPTIKHAGQKVEFYSKSPKILCSKPAYFLVDDRIYQFEKNVDGDKLRPFTTKKFVEIPRRIEESFFKKFGEQLIASFDVHAKGFEITTLHEQHRAVLYVWELQTVVASATLFESSDLDGVPFEDQKMVMELQFRYGDQQFRCDEPNPVKVVFHKGERDELSILKILRDLEWEQRLMEGFREVNMELVNGKKLLPKSVFFDWLSDNYGALQAMGLEIVQKKGEGKRYQIGRAKLEIKIDENIDWFDVKAEVQFGQFSIPFYMLREHILQKRKEFKLPNGEFAVIPESWFTKFSELFAFVQYQDKELILKKHHAGLLDQLHQESHDVVIMHRKLEQLKSFDEIDQVPLPGSFVGSLRPYQYAGFCWMHFLNKYKFGGCLADDMGLGKTVQTLAFLQSIHDDPQVQQASLLVVPTSLLYNWCLEAAKFVPDLRIYLHSGTSRSRSLSAFEGKQLIITSYGLLRQDVELLKEYHFTYLILDESQAIKNPSSHTFKAATLLSSKHKLILTGTPVENSTLDLWSQMTFVNPGLLGSQRFFKEEFLLPIEKKADALKVKKLHALVKPFILRRLKSQVATDLPEKSETTRFCTMTEEQEQLYEETKSYVRNKIMDGHLAQKQLLLLQGLMKLRQIANHPRMVEDSFEGESGKFQDVMYMLDQVLSENHKVLVFSQFVKHLALFEQRLKSQNIPYCYLDGSTQHRNEVVEQFQNKEEFKVFLISLKAGGVGLNLTAAEYVFILDPWWNPAIEAQAIDRAHRIGQKNNVFIYRFISKDTVEEKIMLLQQKKKELAGDLISSEEGFVKSLSKEDIDLILS